MKLNGKSQIKIAGSVILLIVCVWPAVAGLPSGYQAVEGYSSIVGCSNQGDYSTYRGSMTRSYWEYAARAGDYVQWDTASVPSGYITGRTTFIWSGANGIRTGLHDLYLNGRYILRFNSGQTTDHVWTNGSYELFFDFKNENADNAGVYYLTVPVSAIGPSSSARIEVRAAVSGSGLDWIMVHDFADTIDYEMARGQLDYNHIGRSDDVIGGDCADGIQNGDETGVDCGGNCMTADQEVCNGLDDNKNCLIDEGLTCLSKFTYGHYYVIADSSLAQNARDYVRDINDIGYPVLVDVLGFPPEVDMYIADFTLEGFPGGYYAGLRTVDGITGGYIALWDSPISTPASFPRNMCYDLLYETIHGFTASLKYDIHTYQIRHQVINRGEDFDIIFELEALGRLGATSCVDELQSVFYNHSSFPHFPVYYDIRDRYGWEPIRLFLIALNQIKDEVKVDTDDQECFYLSVLIGEDVSPIYEAHNRTISQQTKDMIGQHLNCGSLSVFADRWLESCSEPDWCDGSDMDFSEFVDFVDFAFCALRSPWP